MKRILPYQLFKSKSSLSREQTEWLDTVARNRWSLNPQTGCIDVNGSFDCKRQLLTDFKGLLFGNVSGDFYCQGNRLTSLDGVPKSVGEDFRCNNNQLTSLKGAPGSVGGIFDCSDNRITSLDGVPESIGRSFICNNNQLTNLDGAPGSVGGGFFCSFNYLTSLTGAPQSVTYFNCGYNEQLTNLKGAPKTVSEDFDCERSGLTSLVGAPESVGKDFECNHNQLTSLEGAPESVGKDFDCVGNPLKSLEGAPESVGIFKISRWDSDPGISTLDWNKGWDKGDKEFTKTLTSKLKEINALGSDADKGEPISMLMSLAEPNLLDYLLSNNLSTSDKFEVYGAIKDNTPDVWNKLKDELDPEGATSDLLDLGF